MRGRDLFQTIKPILIAAATVLRIFPHRLVAATWWLVGWIPGHLGVALRYVYARRLCKSCGDNVYIGPTVEIRNWSRLSLGSNVSIHRFCWIDAVGSIDIGDDVRIGHGSSIISFEHDWADSSRPIGDQALVLRPVSIGPDVYISSGTRILGGAVIGRRVVIAANAVVSRHATLRQGIYGGTPSRLLKELP
jgi:acetyltransferase-like isoleucine patch superfamily enzyme